ncbi:hypothetical protein DBT53_002640 [Aerococcus mictus]|uniref:hypothetical protein n=1 Tax=Aerococcus mictus TaxID=2976810 RepID=UPI002FD500AE
MTIVQDLSEDAKAVAGGLFGLGLTALNFEMMVNEPTKRMQAALDELVAAKMILSRPLNQAGGLSYAPVEGADFKPLAEWMRSNGRDPALPIR